MVLFKAKEPLKLEETNKVYATASIRKIRKSLAVCEIEGNNSENCKKLFNELNINIIED